MNRDEIEPSNNLQEQPTSPDPSGEVTLSDVLPPVEHTLEEVKKTTPPKVEGGTIFSMEGTAEDILKYLKAAIETGLRPTVPIKFNLQIPDQNKLKEFIEKLRQADSKKSDQPDPR